MRSILLLLIALLGATGALADAERSDEVSREADVRPRTYVDMRLGATTEIGWVRLCAAGYPVEVVAIEACGNGSGFLHQLDAPEIAHFRGKVRLMQLDFAPVYLEPWIAVGFAELQVAPDAPGFDFFGTGPTGAETAGAEVGAMGRAIVPLAWGFEAVGTLGVNLAFFPFAPKLVLPQQPWQPSVSADIGLAW